MDRRMRTGAGALAVALALVMTTVGCAEGPSDEVLARVSGGGGAPAAGEGAGADGDASSPDLRDELAAGGLSDATITCLLDAAEDAGLDLGALDPTAPASPETAAALAPCLDDLMSEMFDQFGDEMNDAFTDGFGDLFGDDGVPPDFGSPTSQADLDRLADACRGGDNAACDDLWLSSPIDSPEERLAESCGGRSTEPRYASCELFLD